MAGSHQLWRLDLMTGYIDLHAGTGGEALQDGLLLDALLAQPSGLASDGENLFFADSETSAIRRASYHERGRIETLVGTGLFDFGDVDGTGDRVRLQHPQGVAWHRGKLYIADTYNDKIKVLDPDTRTVTSLLMREAHSEDAVASSNTLYEPGGLSVYRGKLYVADTNHHAIRVTDLSTLRGFNSACPRVIGKQSSHNTWPFMLRTSILQPDVLSVIGCPLTDVRQCSVDQAIDSSTVLHPITPTVDDNLRTKQRVQVDRHSQTCQRRDEEDVPVQVQRFQQRVLRRHPDPRNPIVLFQSKLGMNGISPHQRQQTQRILPAQAEAHRAAPPAGGISHRDARTADPRMQSPDA